MTLRSQLRARFGDLPEWVDERLDHAETDHLDGWARAMVTESSLEDILSA